ncbi:MAG: hypothetical protein WD709_03490 [Gammaproteobacteria bacterium]
MIVRIKIMALLLLLSACGGGDSGVRKMVQDLDYAINDYAYALRWARTDDAVAYHVNRDGSKPDIDLSDMDAIRVTGFTITEKVLNDDVTAATVSGELNYYHNDYGTLREIEYHQSWWYEPESKKWYVESDFPEFK